MSKLATALMLLVAAGLLAGGDACAHTYLTHPQMMAPHARDGAFANARTLQGLSGQDAELDLGETAEEAGAEAEWNYALNGQDWDAVAEVCVAGREQSPIHIADSGLQAPPTQLITSTFGGAALGTIANASVINTGHSLQVEWEDWASLPEAAVMVAGAALNEFPYNDTELEFRSVPVVPIQFHFHTPSEHVVNGVFFPAELHIVTLISGDDLPSCGAGGCLSVFGVPYVLTEEDNPTLQQFLHDVPLATLEAIALGDDFTFALNSLLPADLTYTTYAGSLTTPPCSEGVRWHFMLEPVPISLQQLQTLQLALSSATQEREGENQEEDGVSERDPALRDHANGGAEHPTLAQVGTRTNNRLPQPLNGRVVYLVPQEA